MLELDFRREVLITGIYETERILAKVQCRPFKIKSNMDRCSEKQEQTMIQMIHSLGIKKSIELKNEIKHRLIAICQG
jgi:hypothetical protein